MSPFLPLAVFASTQLIPNPPAIPREFRGAWVATVDNIDWPKVRGESVDLAKRELVQIMEKAKSLHLNAIIFQVRPSADALYPSRLEPWSEYLTGKQGLAPDPYWDPLSFAIKEAHSRGLQLHAWFNPYRAESPAQHGPNAPDHIANRRPDLVRKYGPFLWMDPGEPEVRKQSLAVILDVVKRYDVDGVHIDDYFYPYKEKGSNGKDLDFPDEASWRKYVQSGGKLDRSDWRRENVNKFVSEMYGEVKRAKPWVQVGISPFGIYRPNVPPGIKAGVDQFADLYADPLKWFQSGWCDYLSPQLYWPIKQKAQSFESLLRWWDSQNTLKRNLWPGMYTTLVQDSPKTYSTKEILDQIGLVRSIERVPSQPLEWGGEVHFSFKVFQSDPGGLDEALIDGPYKIPAVAPGISWSARGPNPTVNWREARGLSNEQAEALAAGSESVRFYGFSAFDGKTWSDWSFGSSPQWSGPQPAGLAVVVVDRYGRISEPAITTRFVRSDPQE